MPIQIIFYWPASLPITIHHNEGALLNSHYSITLKCQYSVSLIGNVLTNPYSLFIVSE